MDLAEHGNAEPRPFLANAALLILALVAIAVAAAFFLPWFSLGEAGGPILARYAPLQHGGVRVTVEYDATNVAKAWESQNDTIIPPALALAAETRKSERDAINKFFRRAGETEELPNKGLIARMAGAQVYHSHTRRLAADGTASDSVMLAIRDGRADHLVAFYEPATDAETLFDPPIPTLDSDLSVGRTWEASGKRLGTNGTLDYRYTAKVLEKRQWHDPAGKIRDALKIETHVVFMAGNETVYDSITQYLLADGLGAVESQSRDPAGAPKSRTEMLAVHEQQLRKPALPPLPKPPEQTQVTGDFTKWELSRFASTRSSNDNSESSVPPTIIATDPPLLLAARYGGGLIAFKADEPGAPAVWRFQPGGTIYGPPAFDPVAGRIYFGAADKRLYALDARGLFLWSFATGDNIVTRPLVADGKVIFASEDRHVYFVDAETGREVWRTKKELGGAIVSSPALINGRAVFGCDDGGVYAFPLNTSEKHWRFAADGPVEAPIVAADGRILASTHSGDLHAIDSAGNGIWSTHVGAELRSAPVVTRDRIYIVDGAGRLRALELGTGRRLWSSQEEDYVGPPVLSGETLIVGSTNGDAHAVDADGKRLGKTWSAASASAPSDGTAGLQIGASEGGGAIWFADTRSVIRRLGPPIVGPVALKANWLLPFSKEPLTSHFLTVAPVAYGEQALVVDGERDIFLLDPRTGKGNRVGSFGEKLAPTVEPTVAGDTLLAIAGTTLHATQLPTGAARWKFDKGESGALPATVAGDTVLWLTQRFPPDVDGKTQLPVGTLHALDLATGAPRWQRPLTGFTGVGQAIVSGTMVITTAPVAAFDLATGEPRWTAQFNDSAIGGGVLNVMSDTLFVGLINNETSVASIAAIRAADGAVIWQAGIGKSPLNPLERPALSGDVLVVPLWSGEIVGVAAADGAELWRHKPAKPRYGAISAANGRVWFIESNARVVALDAKTGRLAAQLALDIDIGNIQAFTPRPLIIGDRVVVPLAMALLGLTDPAVPPQPEKTQP